jgi:hypothetical protein
MMKEPTQFVSTLPKPHEPTLNPKLCQRASKANPSSPQGFLSNAQKNKINLCFVDKLVGFEKVIILELNN